MGEIKWYLFFWLSMSIIKWTILVFTFLDAVIKYEKSKESELSVVGLFFGFIVGGLLIAVPVFALWPMSLFGEKTKFFVFPDKKAQTLMFGYLKQCDE